MNSDKPTFWSLLKESVIMQAVITLLLMVTLCVLIVMGKDVPEVLQASATLVLGYFFGSKTGVAQGRLSASNEIARNIAANAPNTNNNR
jgi:hypothetical protein